MDAKRVSLYERLPEIYRIRDEQLAEVYSDSDGAPIPNHQLKSYLGLVEEMFGAVHENIESLYHDLFIETCDDWVVPYIGDLLGASPLSGEPWTLRADVADTIALRRRKGTLWAMELLAYNLTRWAAHCAEMREGMAWFQHLNHQRPDAGGTPPLAPPGPPRALAARGGTVSLRAPAVLALLGTPFDPFAHTADLRPPIPGGVRHNLPNLAVYLWRRAVYRVPAAKPLAAAAPAAAGPFVVRANINPAPPNQPSSPYVRPGNEPAGRRVRLHNAHLLDVLSLERDGPDKLDTAGMDARLSGLDEMPGPIPAARIDQPGLLAAADYYVSVDTYDAQAATLEGLRIGRAGLQLHLPAAPFADAAWTIRGVNLCAWEAGLQPPLANRQIAIDPVIGRIAIGVASQDEADALLDGLLVTHTYGAPGPVGAHPVGRGGLPEPWLSAVREDPNALVLVDHRQNPQGLMAALAGVSQRTQPLVVEIADSRTHLLDLGDPLLANDVSAEGGAPSLRLSRPLLIRARSGQRPIIQLALPLALRPDRVAGADAAGQRELDALMDALTVRLEGIYLARGMDFPAGEPLIARAALNRLELAGCTLEPGGFRYFDDAAPPSPILPSLRLREPYGFEHEEDEREFKQTPEIILSRTVAGPLQIDEGYRLCLCDTIVDAGQGVDEPAKAYDALANAAGDGHGPPTRISGATLLGRARAASITGAGGIFVHALEVRDTQAGCLKFCYFSGEPADRLPQNHGCVKGVEAGDKKPAALAFVSEAFGEPGYCQLALDCDARVRERGPGNDAMGAYGFLSEAHKWRNLQLRFREFMPAGIRPLLIPIT